MNNVSTMRQTMKMYGIILVSILSIASAQATQTNQEIPRPHENCYWVEPGSFLAGEYPVTIGSIEASREKLRGYLDAGITFFLDLTEERESSSQGRLLRYGQILQEEADARSMKVEHKRMAIRDMSVPSVGLMRKIIITIQTALEEGHKVYVHCWGGIGRTGTVVGCYLIQKGMEGHEALDQIADWWATVTKSNIHPRSPQSLEQRKFVRRFRPIKENPIE